LLENKYTWSYCGIYNLNLLRHCVPVEITSKSYKLTDVHLLAVGAFVQSCIFKIKNTYYFIVFFWHSSKDYLLPVCVCICAQNSAAAAAFDAF